MPEGQQENNEQAKFVESEGLAESGLADAKKERDGTVRTAEATEAALKRENPKAGERFHHGVEHLTGVKLQGSVVEVAVGDGKVRLDTAEKSLQVELDTFLGGLEARTKVVEGGSETSVAANLDLGPVDLSAQGVQDAEGNVSYTGSVKLPEGIRVWVEQNREGVAAGAEYKWENEALGKGTFALKRDETGQVLIEGTLEVKDGPKIKISCANGETAEVKVSSAFSVGDGKLSVNAGLGVQNLGQGLSGVQLGAFGGDVSYTVRF